MQEKTKFSNDLLHLFFSNEKLSDYIFLAEKIIILYKKFVLICRFMIVNKLGVE